MSFKFAEFKEYCYPLPRFLTCYALSTDSPCSPCDSICRCTIS